MFNSSFRKIFREKSPTDFPGGYIPNRFIMERIDGGRVLVVGDYNGRDFRPLKEKYPDSVLLDIVDNGIADQSNLVLQSIEYPTPFEKESFNCVVLAEVVEHLWEDMVALREIHRILCQGGKLLITVPFYHDEPEYHFRIHSPRTIRRLLEHAGFEIIKFSFRGLAIQMPYSLVAGLALLFYPLYGKSSEWVCL